MKYYPFDRPSSPKRSSSTAKQVYTQKTQVIKKNSSLERKPNSTKLDISLNSHKKRLELIYNNIAPIITNRTLTTRSRSLARGVELKKNVKLSPIKKSPPHEKLQIIQTRRKEAFLPTQIVLYIRSPKKIKITQ